LFDNS